MSEIDNLRQRSAEAGDMSFVLATWVRSYASVIPQSRRTWAVLEFRRRYVDRVMAADPHIVVICSPTVRTALYGYAIELDGAIAWTYVAKDLRGRGVSRQAMTAALRGYPESITTRCVWPFASKRFKFEPLPRSQDATGLRFVPRRHAGTSPGETDGDPQAGDLRRARGAGGGG